MSRLQSSELAEAVDLVYEAALRPELWPFALTQISEILGSDSVGIFAYPNGAAEWAVWSERSLELIDWFVRGGWHLNNPRPQRAIRVLGQMRAGTESDLFTPWELEHIAFNASMRHELGYLWDAGVIAGEINGEAVVFATQRFRTRERFGRDEVAAIQALGPHLARAIQITARIGLHKAQGMLGALELMGCAALLIDYAGRPIRLNTKAEQLLDRAFSISGGKLRATHPAADPRLQQLLREVYARPSPIGTQVPVSAVLPRTRQRPLVVYGVPIVRTAQEVLQKVKAILVFVDPDEHRDPVDIVLQQAFGLTAAEIRIAKGIARGEDLKDIAEQHGISIGTARAQLKSVMAKSETHRQSELVSLMMRLSGPMNFVENGTGRLQRANSSLR
jgi:DNA-binding CsgD family transcriptional regulator/PAS domain-containing protein